MSSALLAEKKTPHAPGIIRVRVCEDIPSDVRVIEGERFDNRTAYEKENEIGGYREVVLEIKPGDEMLTRIVRIWSNIEILIPAGLLSEDRDAGDAEGMFDILNHEGGRRVQWFKNNLASIHEARTLFNELVGQGLVPHRVGSNGLETTEIMKTFEPSAEEVVFSSPRAMVGG